MDLPVTSWLRAELDRLWKELETGEIGLSVKSCSSLMKSLKSIRMPSRKDFLRPINHSSSVALKSGHNI